MATERLDALPKLLAATPSRRSVLKTAAGAGLVALGGSLGRNEAAAASPQRPFPQRSPMPTPSTPTSAPETS